MAWTAPRTWVPGELVTAALGNAHWRDNLNALRDYLLGAQDLGAQWLVAGGRSVGIGGTPANLLHLYGTVGTVGIAEAIIEGRFNGYGAGLELSSRTSSGGTLLPMAKIVADGTGAWTTTVSTQDAKLSIFTAVDGVLTLGLLVANGGADVGFAGAPVSKVLRVGDADFALYFDYGGGGVPAVVFDPLDRIQYTRSTNKWEHIIGSVAKLQVDSAGAGLVDGTSSLPSLYFISDPDSGVFSLGANILGFAVGGSEGARLSAGALSVSHAGSSAALYLGAGSVRGLKWNSIEFADNVQVGYVDLSGPVITMSEELGTITFDAENGDVFPIVSAELATTVTQGWMWATTQNGAPTGAPASRTGVSPITVDRSNGRLYAYYGGAWHYATLT